MSVESKWKIRLSDEDIRALPNSAIEPLSRRIKRNHRIIWLLALVAVISYYEFIAPPDYSGGGGISTSFLIWTISFMFSWVFINLMSEGRAKHARKIHDYDWYINEQPQCAPVNNNGQVGCFYCGSTKVSARRMMAGTYTTEHYCTQCGRSLYYSPEIISPGSV